VVGTCATSWFFGENSVGRSTAREEGKREAKRNATELATVDMGYSQLKELAQ